MYCASVGICTLEKTETTHMEVSAGVSVALKIDDTATLNTKE